MSVHCVLCWYILVNYPEFMSFWLWTCWAGVRDCGSRPRVGEGTSCSACRCMPCLIVDIIIWAIYMSAVSNYSYLRITSVILSASWEEESCQWKENHGKILWLPFIYTATESHSYLFLLSPQIVLKTLTMPVLPKRGHFDIFPSSFPKLLLVLPCNQTTHSWMGAPAYPISMTLLLELHLPFMTNIQCLEVFSDFSSWKWSLLYFLNFNSIFSMLFF